MTLSKQKYFPKASPPNTFNSWGSQHLNIGVTIQSVTSSTTPTEYSGILDRIERLNDHL